MKVNYALSVNLFILNHFYLFNLTSSQNWNNNNNKENYKLFEVKNLNSFFDILILHNIYNFPHKSSQLLR